MRSMPGIYTLVRALVVLSVSPYATRICRRYGFFTLRRKRLVLPTAMPPERLHWLCDGSVSLSRPLWLLPDLLQFDAL